MENKKHKGEGKLLADSLFHGLEPTFLAEDFLNAAQVKVMLGLLIKDKVIGGYRNLEWNNYKALFDVLANDKQTYHMGIDFGQQAVHVTLGVGDVYSLYFRNPTVPEW
jgi:hypothetical protein